MVFCADPRDHLHLPHLGLVSMTLKSGDHRLRPRPGLHQNLVFVHPMSALAVLHPSQISQLK